MVGGVEHHSDISRKKKYLFTHPDDSPPPPSKGKCVGFYSILPQPTALVMDKEQRSDWLFSSYLKKS